MAERAHSMSPLFTWRSAVSSKGSGLPAPARHVALAMSLYMNERGSSAFPGASRLSDDTGLHLRTVRTHLQLLEREGWLGVRKRGGSPAGGSRMATEYVCMIPRTSGGAPPVEGSTGGGDAPVTGGRLAPVAEDDRSSSMHRPVALVTPTGGGGPPQHASTTPENTPLAPTAVGAVESDPLRSAVLAACELDPSRMTSTAEQSLARALRDLAEAGAEASAIPPAVARFRNLFPAATLTPPALAKHWPRLAPSAPAEVQTTSPAERFGIALGRTEPVEARALTAILEEFADDSEAQARARAAYDRTIAATREAG